jgi:hypothetical protein
VYGKQKQNKKRRKLQADTPTSTPAILQGVDYPLFPGISNLVIDLFVVETVLRATPTVCYLSFPSLFFLAT